MDQFSIVYQPLFRVRVLHHYWLNFGAVDFNNPPADNSPATQAIIQSIELLRRQYDVRQFWTLWPDSATAQVLAGNRMLFKPVSDGFYVLLPTEGNRPELPLTVDFKLVFTIRVTDPMFWVYTQIAEAMVADVLKNNRRFRLKNGNSAALPAIETLTQADLDPPPVPPPANAPPAAMPMKTAEVGYLDIAHQPAQGRLLLTNTGELQPGLTFDLVLANRPTEWEFNGATLPGGPFPLVQNGLIAVSLGTRKLPNPTPATTENRGGTYVSRIF